ncbi:TLDc domain-containing protein [Entamoeba marina]
MDVLKSWCGKNRYTIIFDSDRDGGCNTCLFHKVFNKSNLYFISFDSDDNVFGGYVSTSVVKGDIQIHDSNSFIFSLMRNGAITNKKYSIKSSRSRDAFTISSSLSCLYFFGFDSADIFIDKIGLPKSRCCLNCFQYHNIKDVLVNKNKPETFITERVLVLQME